jgi:hypothetical protein
MATEFSDLVVCVDNSGYDDACIGSIVKSRLRVSAETSAAMPGRPMTARMWAEQKFFERLGLLECFSQVTTGQLGSGRERTECISHGAPSSCRLGQVVRRLEIHPQPR